MVVRERVRGREKPPVAGGSIRRVDLSRAAKPRPRREFVMRAIQPVAARVIAVFARTGIDPLHVVLTHGLLGFLAAALIAVGGQVAWAAAALMLIAKVLLDNVDGGLARATGRVTQVGRYLDTWVDFWNNVALFVALSFYGPATWAAAALAVLTVVLTVDFNLERLYREARTGPPDPDEPASPAVPAGAPPVLFRWLQGGYDAFFAPQDRAVGQLDRWMLRAVTPRGETIDGEVRRRWNDLFSTAAIVNLGLSTQLTALALLLIFGAPFVYVVVVLLQAPYLVCVALLRIVRFRAYLHER